MFGTLTDGFFFQVVSFLHEPWSYSGLNLLIWQRVDDVGAVRKSQVDDTENTIRFTMPGQTDLFCWGWGVFTTKRVWGKGKLVDLLKTITKCHAFLNSLVQSCFTCFNFIEAFAEHLAEDYPIQSHWATWSLGLGQMRSGLRSSNATGHAVGHANAQVCGVGGGVRDAKGIKKAMRNIRLLQWIAHCGTQVRGSRRF